MKKGDVLGEVVYSINGEIIGKSEIKALDNVYKTNFKDIAFKIFKKLIMLK